MSFTTATAGASAILPAEYGAMITKPLEARSIAFHPAAASVQSLAANEMRIPILVKDPAVSWVAEGEEISESVPEMDQITVRPTKVAGITPITRELANDSNPAAQQIVGEGLARDIAHKVDAAFLGNVGGHAPGGLETVDGVHTVDGGDLPNLDPLAEAISALETAGHQATGFITDPATALRITTLKAGDGSNAPLLQDSRQVFQRPILVSPYVSTGTIWTVDASMIHTALREDVEIAVSEHAFFNTDRIALRAICRIGFAHPAPDAIARVSVTPAPDEG